MRHTLITLAVVAAAAGPAPATAEGLSDPGCAAIEEWVSTLNIERDQASVQMRSELLEQAFTDERTEPVFGMAFSRWQLPQYESAGNTLTRCQTEARMRRDANASARVGQANARVQDRLRRLRRMNIADPMIAVGGNAKVERPDCESLETWASVLLTQGQRRQAIIDGLNTVEMDEQRQATLLSDAEIEPRFGHPISEWTYNDYLYASDPISGCAGQARIAGDHESHQQLRSAYSIIRRLGNEFR